ncbi:GNAT family N-acetyltransferase [Vibrio alginolyticus]|uniref:GNAT family N-acetyltransferase n=1 Tax=Vibrio alginolyticus TaxID=663 RepID=UPI00355074BD|nr:GNAT family N-acetyltransferase [Vibrio alginolyticus]
MVNYKIKASCPISIDILKDPDFQAIRKLLEPVSGLYPSFDAWFNFRFKRNFSSGNRIVIAAMSGSTIAGVALLKKTESEHKICTLFVREEFRGLGVGRQLLTKAIENLKGNKIGISVAEERHQALKSLLEKQGFSLKSKEIGYYRQGAVEFFYELDCG